MASSCGDLQSIQGEGGETGPPGARRAVPLPPPGSGSVDAPPEDVLTVVWQRRWVILPVLVSCLAAAAVYLWVATPIYTATSQIYVAPSVPNLTTGQHDIPLRAENYVNTQCQLMVSAAVIDPVIERPDVRQMKTFADATDLRLSLKERLIVAAGRRDDFITVSMESPYPDEAAHLVNHVVGSYLHYQRSQARAVAAEMLEILEQEKAQRATAVRDQRRELLRRKQEHAALSFSDEKSNLTLQRLAQLSEALTAAEVETLRAAASYDAAKAAANDPGRAAYPADGFAAPGPAAPGARAGDRAHSDIADELLKLEVRLTASKRQLGANHPGLRALAQTIADLRDKLAERDRAAANVYVEVLRQAWEVAREQQAAVAAAFQEQKDQAVGLNGVAAEMAVLEADVRQAQSAADGLDARIMELRLARDAGALRVKVVEPARPDGPPTGPRKAVVLGGAGMLGLLLGSACAFVRGMTDRRLYSCEQISGALRLPVVSTVPVINDSSTPAGRGMVAFLDPRSAAAEAYRMVRTAVYSGARGSRPVKTLLITSPVQHEGKSTLASNLAITLAQAGNRTLLLDADLRRPSLHTVFGLENRMGVSNVLRGEMSPSYAVQRTPCEGLDVMPSGPLPPNPAELLNSAAFTHLLRQLAQRYDRIVLDAPPATGLADALIISAACDATLLVLRPGRSRREPSEDTCAALSRVGARLLGVVVNGMRSRGAPYPYAESRAGIVRPVSAEPGTGWSGSTCLPVDEPRGATPRRAGTGDPDALEPWETAREVMQRPADAQFVPLGTAPSEANERDEGRENAPRV